MKRTFSYAFSLLLLAFLVSCQKERSFETDNSPARGSLQNDLTDECLPKTINGAFVAGEALDDTNYVEVTIDFTQTGTYNIGTDTANGIWFRGSGTASSTGITTVKLKGFGTPATGGINTFMVLFDSSICYFQINVLPPGSGGPAVFTLESSAGNCIDYNLQGDYVKSVALTAANKVDIKVNVTTVGTYSITSAAVNGITFTGAGSFTTTGVQVVTLTGAGTPVNTGASTIPVTVGASSCNFVVTVTDTAPPPPPPGDDYYPRTTNSYWTYEFDDVDEDTLRRHVIAQTLNAGGSSYNIFMSTEDASAGYDSAGYFRRSGGDYYEWLDMGAFWGFDDEMWAPYIFLKDDQPQGHTWNSSAITGNLAGTPLTFRFAHKILQKDVSIVVNGITFQNTIVIEEKYEVNQAGTWVDLTPAFGTATAYFAKGIGLIKIEFVDPSVSSKVELIHYQVF